MGNALLDARDRIASLDGVDGGTLRLMRMMGALRLMGEIGNSLLDVEDGERFA